MRRPPPKRPHYRTASYRPESMKKTTLSLLAVLAWNLVSPTTAHAQRTVDSDSVDTTEVRISNYLTEATSLRTESEKLDPDSDETKELERLEALALFQAAFLGDETQKSRRETIVAELRSSESIPPGKRAELVALMGNLEVSQQLGESIEKRISDHEKVTRAVLAEFPEYTAGYESLFGLAMSRSEAAAVEVASEILEMPAPEPLQERAWFLLNRHSMIGHPILDYVAGLDEIEKAVTSYEGSPIIVYSWASWHSGSVEMARAIVDQAPPGTGLIGVNLDTQVGSARNAVASEGLSNVQLYDPDGPQGRIARALSLNEAPVAILVDREGIVTSVSAHRSLSSAFASLSNR